MSQGPFVHRLRVRWSEIDAQGVVFNPNYFVFADVAATEFLRDRGVLGALDEEMQQIFVVDAHAGFKGSARFDDELDIAVRLDRLGRSSFALAVEIRREQTLLTNISLTYVRAVDGVATPISPTLRDRLTGDA